MGKMSSSKRCQFRAFLIVLLFVAWRLQLHKMWEMQRQWVDDEHMESVLVAPAKLVSNPGSPRKINFVHITKTGGTTIGHLSRVNNFTCGLWGSRREANLPHLTSNSSWRISIAGDSSVAGNSSLFAVEWHVPPGLIASNTLHDELYPHEDTFCIIRHPLERLISEYYWRYTLPGKYRRGPCFDDSVNYTNHEMARMLRLILASNATTCKDDCHNLAQSAYLRDKPYNLVGRKDKQTTSSQLQSNEGDRIVDKSCNRVLVMGFNLTQQFNHLMAEMNCPIRMGNERENRGRAVCPNAPRRYPLGERDPNIGKEYHVITTDELSEEVLDLAHEIYHEDFIMYGYYAQKVLHEQQKQQEDKEE